MKLFQCECGGWLSNPRIDFIEDDTIYINAKCENCLEDCVVESQIKNIHKVK